jgi:hypothetical protein
VPAVLGCRSGLLFVPRSPGIPHSALQLDRSSLRSGLATISSKGGAALLFSLSSHLVISVGCETPAYDVTNPGRQVVQTHYMGHKKDTPEYTSTT